MQVTEKNNSNRRQICFDKNAIYRQGKCKPLTNLLLKIQVIEKENTSHLC